MDKVILRQIEKLSAEALAAQDQDAGLKELFGRLAETLKANEETILEELNGVQGQSVDIKGYYAPSPELAAKAMRPSATLNGIIDSI